MRAERGWLPIAGRAVLVDQHAVPDVEVVCQPMLGDERRDVRRPQHPVDLDAVLVKDTAEVGLHAVDVVLVTPARRRSAVRRCGVEAAYVVEP